jgi:hypothetical protein
MLVWIVLNPVQKVCYSYVNEPCMYKWHTNEWYIVESILYLFIGAEDFHYSENLDPQKFANIRTES